ncbi:2-amino-4-hydroxy-6-hydroxymethyldihydropteridine diphosphokinase [Vibrio sp.]|uniref:2-amino-4-hydroxy-6- hydroxymethyldihydropteridine diphosphokinase n=1 Tax=Vibrio sp. TaxID=678 RepID=UPI003D0AE8BA
MITCYIGIGSNIERRKHIEAACRALTQLGERLRLSTIYQCESLGFDSHPFYNLVVELQTALPLTTLAEKLRAIEHGYGRALDAQKFQDRTLDLDLILYGDAISDQSPKIPRPDIYYYPFVIQPLYELCPQLSIPGDEQTVEQIWLKAANLACLTPVPLWFSIDNE